jgi:hypothetical protein
MKTTKKKAKKSTARKAGAKKTGRKQITSKKAAPKRTRRISKKRIITDRKETVLGRLKNVFDDTAAKIKTLLPGEPETQVAEPEQPRRDIR